MKLAANLTLVYSGLPEAERFAQAARDGFVGVEILFPYSNPPEWYTERLRANALELVLINTPVGDGPARAGLAAIPGKQEEFRTAFERAMAVVRATTCRTIHVMAGIVDDIRPTRWRPVLEENLRWAAARCSSENVVLTLEALNRVDFPGYAYHQPREALAVIEQLALPNVRLQFDLYHTAKEGLDLPAELTHALPYVRHIQIAGAPERNEPDLAKDKLLDCFELLVHRGYSGWIGCEYRPRALPDGYLAWREPLLQKGWLRQ
ncbi:MAG: hydroxypyruvate isomerase family protein [Sulfurifustis sp.]